MTRWSKLKEWLVDVLRPLLFGAHVYSLIAAATILSLCVLGYGSWIRTFSIPLFVVGALGLSIVLMLGRFQFWLWKRLGHHEQPKTSRGDFAKSHVIALAVFAIACGASFFLGSYLRKRRAERKVHQCTKLIAALEEHKKKTGRLPDDEADLKALDAFKTLRHSELVYFGERSTNGLSWAAEKIANADVSVFVLSNSFQLVIPIERMSPITFSSFRVLTYESAHGHWRKTLLHWSLMGAYFDAD